MGEDVAIVARNPKVLPVIASNLFCHTFAPHSVKVHLICFGEKEMFFVLFQAS